MNRSALRASAKKDRPCNRENRRDETDAGQKDDRPPPFPSNEPLGHLSC